MIRAEALPKPELSLPTRLVNGFGELNSTIRYGLAGTALAALFGAGIAAVKFTPKAEAATVVAAANKDSQVNVHACPSFVHTDGVAPGEVRSEWYKYFGDAYDPGINSPAAFNRELRVKKADIKAKTGLSEKAYEALQKAPICDSTLENGSDGHAQTWQVGLSGHSTEHNLQVAYGTKAGNMAGKTQYAYYKTAIVGNTEYIMGDPGCGNILLNRFTLPPNIKPPAATVPKAPKTIPKTPKTPGEAPVTPGIYKELFIQTGVATEKQIAVPTGKFKVDEYVYRGGRFDAKHNKVLGGHLLKHGVITIMGAPEKGQKALSGPQGSNFLFKERSNKGYRQENPVIWWPNGRGDNNPKTIDKTIVIKNVELPKGTTPPPASSSCVRLETRQTGAESLAVKADFTTVPTQEVKFSWGDQQSAVYRGSYSVNGNIQTEEVDHNFPGNGPYDVEVLVNGQPQPACEGEFGFSTPTPPTTTTTPNTPPTTTTTPTTTGNTPKGPNNPPQPTDAGNTNPTPPETTTTTETIGGTTTIVTTTDTRTTPSTSCPPGWNWNPNDDRCE